MYRSTRLAINRIEIPLRIVYTQYLLHTHAANGFLLQ